MDRFKLAWVAADRRSGGEVAFPPQGTLQIGRAPTNDLAILEDTLISRQHAVAEIRGEEFLIRCLDAATNPLVHGGKKHRELQLTAGDTFQIGRTEFRCVDLNEKSLAVTSRYSDPEMQIHGHRGRETIYTSEALQRAEFGDPKDQMEILANLPEYIATTSSDEELAVKIAELLLKGIPQADAVAVVQYAESDLSWTPEGTAQPPSPALVRVAARETYAGRFRPSRRLMLKCLRHGQSVIHITEHEGDSAQFTISDDLDWSFSAPIRGAASAGWCLYVSGHKFRLRRHQTEEELLQGDLRFTELLGKFIGSIRHVRTLQNQQTQLSSFFSPKVIENLTSAKSISRGLVPAECDVTVLFCDLRGFSERSEALRHDLPALFQCVSQALGVMANGVLEQNGAIADFQGDAILGFWGWPISDEEGPWPACRAALSIIEDFINVNEQWDSVLMGLSVGIGVAHGRALAGRIGTEQQAKIGVFGPVVNQGSRLEGMTKQLGVLICIDEATAEHIRKHVPPTAARTRFLSRIRPKGMRTPIHVYELLPGESSSHISTASIAAHELVVNGIIKGNWDQAREDLRRLPQNDGPANFLRTFLSKAPPAPGSDWDGVIQLESK